MNQILNKLRGGDFRSIGKSNEVAKIVLENPKLFSSVFSGLLGSDPLIRMRAADAIEKITARKPELLQKFKKSLLDRVATIEQQEIQWHVAQIIPRLKLTNNDMVQVLKILNRYLNTSRSNIVRVMSLQALAELALQKKLNSEEISSNLEHYARTINTPSVQARVKKLLKKLASSFRN